MPSERVLVRVVRLEYEMVVVHGGKVMVVGVDRGMGGCQMSDAPGGAVTTGAAELQISGLI
jgi:hypothetical protein